jgi:hypothetical protein
LPRSYETLNSLHTKRVDGALKRFVGDAADGVDRRLRRDDRA